MVAVCGCLLLQLIVVEQQTSLRKYLPTRKILGVFLVDCTLFYSLFVSPRHFPDWRLFMPHGTYSDAHTFAHLSGYHIIEVQEPAPHGMPA